MKPRRSDHRLMPVTGQWAQHATDHEFTAYVDRGAWLLALSSYFKSPMPGAPEILGPTWHVSMSQIGTTHTPSNEQMNHLFDTWRITQWEEDNHSPGKARHIFIPVDQNYRGVCECKLTEPQVVSLDGVPWSNTTLDTGICAGCRIAAMPRGRPCQIHSLIGHTPQLETP